MSEGDQYLDQLIVFVLLCSSGLPADDSPVPKHVGV